MKILFINNSIGKRTEVDKHGKLSELFKEVEEVLDKWNEGDITRRKYLDSGREYAYSSIYISLPVSDNGEIDFESDNTTNGDFYVYKPLFDCKYDVAVRGVEYLKEGEESDKSFTVKNVYAPGKTGGLWGKNNTIGKSLCCFADAEHLKTGQYVCSECGRYYHYG